MQSSLLDWKVCFLKAPGKSSVLATQLPPLLGSSSHSSVASCQIGFQVTLLPNSELVCRAHRGVAPHKPSVLGTQLYCAILGWNGCALLASGHSSVLGICFSTTELDQTAHVLCSKDPHCVQCCGDSSQYLLVSKTPLFARYLWALSTMWTSGSA